jgi:hypothetical protein
VARDFDVGRLQVSMDDASLVRGLKRVSELPGDELGVADPQTKNTLRFPDPSPARAADVCKSLDPRRPVRHDVDPLLGVLFDAHLHQEALAVRR